MSPELGTGVRVRVPATSANLGPGFDSLGLALGLYDTITVRVVDGPVCRVDMEGEGAGRLPRDERHLVLRAASATFSSVGVDRPALHLSCDNAVPHSRGLGSSAAAAVAGIAAARALLGKKGPDDDAVLDLAAGFDGHADNVAACLHGGLAVSWGHRGAFRTARLDPHPDLRPIAFVADRTSSTDATRGLLPDRVAHGDAAFNAARAALMVHALTTDPDLLMPATEDRLHQPYRRPAYPETAALVDELRARDVPAVVSGAGPTVLALATVATAGAVIPDDVATEGFTVLPLPVDTAGTVTELL